MDYTNLKRIVAEAGLDQLSVSRLITEGLHGCWVACDGGCLVCNQPKVN